VTLENAQLHENATRREQELAEKWALLQAALEHLSPAVSVFDKDLRLAAWNTHLLDLLGFPQEFGRVGKPLADFLRYNAERGEYGPGDPEDHVAQRVALALRFEPHRFERVRPDGTVVEVRGSPMPNGGFVTGGGWINSPPGAYLADPTVTGKATFGFVAKYKKGSQTPDGNTEFQFHAGDLKFKSSSYDFGSLVVAGMKALYKGSGTINGAGDYAFRVWAIDGKDASQPDRFRIKIWNKTGGTVVYDNQTGGADDADPTTELGGGNITIHK